MLSAGKTSPSPRDPASPGALGLEFYTRPAVEVARDLVGKVLARRVGRRVLRARVVEVEAYCGPEDLACHSSKGLTKRTRVLLGPAGHAYVYLIYGMHQMLNVVTGGGQAVLLRAAEPLDGWAANLTGPGRLARAMKIGPRDNGMTLMGPAIWFENGGDPRPNLTATKRIGVEYSGPWKHALLRFYETKNAAVSKPLQPK